MHIWSLCIEEQFYLIWPILLIAINSIFNKKNNNAKFNRKLTLICVILISISSYTSFVYLSKTKPDKAFFLPLTRLWELSLGTVGALCTTSLINKNNHNYISLICLCIVFSSLALCHTI